MKFSISREFSWDTEECIPHFYQVTSKCESPPLDPTKCQTNNGPDGGCPSVTIATIMACTVEEVCQQVKKKFKGFKIDKIVKFTKPALTRDQTGKEDPTCNVVVPTPPGCQESSHSSESSSEGSSGIHVLWPELDSSGGSVRRVNYIRSLPTLNLQSPNSTTESHKMMMSGGLGEVANFSYYGSGSITFTGSAPLDSDDAGVLTQSIIFSESLTDVTIAQAFVPNPVLPLVQTTQTIKIPCSEATFTLTLELKHTLNQIKIFADFLKTNNIKLPGVLRPGILTGDFIKLNYATRDDQWRTNLHYMGQSAQGPFQESWDIGITFGCITQYWPFTMTVLNTQPSQRLSSRLVAYYKRRDVCPNSDTFFGFSFVLNTTLLSSSPALAQPLVLNDDAGFFRNLQQLEFRIVPQNRGTGSTLLPVDNSAAYDASFVSSGGN